MATKNEAIPRPDDDDLKRDEFSDFIIVLKDGRELQCHKFALAKASRVFRLMLRQDCEETRASKIKLTEFEPETVESFLDFIYADLQHVPDQNLLKKKFDEKRLTTDLLRMSHMYEVTILLDMCVEFLKKNIVDTNVVDIWSAAETTGSGRLKDVALNHLGKKGEKMLDVPRMEEAYESPQMMKSLAKYQLIERHVKHTSQPTDTAIQKDEIIVNIKYSGGYFNRLYLSPKNYTVEVKPSDKIRTLRILMNAALSRDGRSSWECQSVSFEQQLQPGSQIIETTLEDSQTLAGYGITSGSTFTCKLEKNESAQSVEFEKPIEEKVRKSKMTSNDEASLIPDEDGLNRDEFSDFILVLKDGRELPCHKFALAKASRVFRVMLRLDCEETLTSKMKVTEFEADTAESFLDFIYADLQHIPDQDVFKKRFDEKRLTLDLLRMSHMYGVTILQEKCIEYLKKNIEDNNVVEVWSAAETTGSVRLKDAALHYLGKKGKEMLDVPRMKEAYQSPQLMESLVKYTSSRIDPSADAEITVHMDCSEYWKGKKYAVKVRPSDTIKTLRILTSAALSRDGQGHWDCRKVSLSFEHQLPSRTDDIESSPLHDYKTIANYGIIAGSTFTCELK